MQNVNTQRNVSMGSTVIPSRYEAPFAYRRDVNTPAMAHVPGNLNYYEAPVGGQTVPYSPNSMNGVPYTRQPSAQVIIGGAPTVLPAGVLPMGMGR